MAYGRSPLNEAVRNTVSDIRYQYQRYSERDQNYAGRVEAARRGEARSG
jgi:hypothetical protein